MMATTTKITIWYGQPIGQTMVAIPVAAGAPAGHKSQPEPLISSPIRKTPPSAIQSQNGWEKKRASAAPIASAPGHRRRGRRRLARRRRPWRRRADAALRAAHQLGDAGDRAGDAGEVGRDDDRALLVGVGQLAERLDVLLGHEIVQGVHR